MEISPDLPAISILAIGFILGLQHAIEADHLAAVSTIVSEQKSLLAASIVGGLWGLGHTVALLTVGIAVIALKLKIPETAENYLEGTVGIMLVLLGLNALRKLLFAEKVHIHRHKHGTREHVHLHVHAAPTAADDSVAGQHHTISPRSVLVGMIHGLAGSAALMLLILPAIPSPALAIFYIAVFGIGSVGGMMLMSFLIGLPLHLTAKRFDLMNKGIRLAAGLFSLGLGFVLIHEKLIAA